MRISNTPILGIQKYSFWQIWCRGMRACSATPKLRIFARCAFQTPPYLVSKNTFCGRFSVEVWALGAPRQNPTFFGIAQFKHPHPRYLKNIFLADLVQRYALLDRHAQSPHFLALRTSNTPILGIQKHSFWQIWCKGMRAWSATPKTHIFWHCAFQTPPS